MGICYRLLEQEDVDKAFCRQLKKRHICRPMGFNGMHPQVLMELASVTGRPLSIVFERSWSLEEVPEDWKKRIVSPVFRKGKKEGLGNYRDIHLIFIPGKDGANNPETHFYI